MMRSLKPDLTPDGCRQILRATARPMTFENREVPRALDAAAAVAEAAAIRAGVSASPFRTYP